MPQTLSPNPQADSEISVPDACPGVTGLLVLLLAVYGVTAFPDFRHPADWAYAWGAFYTPAVLAGEGWRLLTANLLHADPLHLLNNLFGLWVFGRLLEPLLGTRSMVFLFILTVLGTTLTSLAADLAGALWLGGIVPRPSVGASGIDYGLMGAWLTFCLLVLRKIAPERFLSDFRKMLLLVTVYAFLNLTTPGLNVWGHLGGFLAGVAFALIRFVRFDPPNQTA